jgi:hypothetical protein
MRLEPTRSPGRGDRDLRHISAQKMKMLPSEDSNPLPANAGWATVVLPTTWTGSTAGRTYPQPLQTRRTVDAPTR